MSTHFRRVRTVMNVEFRPFVCLTEREMDESCDIVYSIYHLNGGCMVLGVCALFLKVCVCACVFFLREVHFIIVKCISKSLTSQCLTHANTHTLRAHLSFLDLELIYHPGEQPVFTRLHLHLLVWNTLLSKVKTEGRDSSSGSVRDLEVNTTICSIKQMSVRVELISVISGPCRLFHHRRTTNRKSHLLLDSLWGLHCARWRPKVVE